MQRSHDTRGGDASRGPKGGIVVLRGVQGQPGASAVMETCLAWGTPRLEKAWLPASTTLTSRARPCLNMGPADSQRLVLGGTWRRPASLLHWRPSPDEVICRGVGEHQGLVGRRAVNLPGRWPCTRVLTKCSVQDGKRNLRPQKELQMREPFLFVVRHGCPCGHSTARAGASVRFAGRFVFPVWAGSST